MFGTIRKHQKWLWFVIIVVIVISFVIYFSPDARWSSRGRGGGGDIGTIDGRPVSVHDYQQAYRETRLLYFLNFQKWPESDVERARQMNFDMETETYMRLIRLAKVKAEKIRISDEAVGELARRLLGPKTPLDGFVREVLAPAGLTELDFERFLRNDAAIQQLGAVAGLPGKLVPPREIESAYRENHEEVALDAVFFPLSNYLAVVTVTETNLLQWYTNNMADFRIPDRVRVSYVEINSSNFLPEVDKRLAEITNLNSQLEQVYAKQDPESFKDENGKVLAKAAALEKIKNLERTRSALHLAARKANELASALYDEKDHHVANFEKFVATNGYQTRLSEPFDEQEGPQDLKVGPDFARLAFTLTNQEEAIAFKPVEGADSLYLFASKEFIPSSNPSLESIRSNVVERYRFTEAQKLVRLTGMGFQSKLSDGLAQGKTFTQVVTESSLKSVTLPPLSRSDRQVANLPETIYLPQLKDVVFGGQYRPPLQVGKASSFIPTMDGGFIVFLRTKLPIDETRMKAALPEYAASLRGQRQNEAFGMWFRKQTEHADLPITRASTKAAGAKTGGAEPKAK